MLYTFLTYKAQSIPPETQVVIVKKKFQRFALKMSALAYIYKLAI